MTADQARSLVMSVAGSATASSAFQQGASWAWKAGTALFPETVCPLCSTAMTSKWIWVVDENGRQVVAIYKIWRKRLVKVQQMGMQALHPHVYPSYRSTGPWRVCTGSTVGITAHQALFGNALDLTHGMGDFVLLPMMRARSREVVIARRARWLSRCYGHICPANVAESGREAATSE